MKLLTGLIIAIFMQVPLSLAEEPKCRYTVLYRFMFNNTGIRPIIDGHSYSGYQNFQWKSSADAFILALTSSSNRRGHTFEWMRVYHSTVAKSNEIADFACPE